MPSWFRSSKSKKSTDETNRTNTNNTSTSTPASNAPAAAVPAEARPASQSLDHTAADASRAAPVHTIQPTRSFPGSLHARKASFGHALSVETGVMAPGRPHSPLSMRSSSSGKVLTRHASASLGQSPGGYTRMRSPSASLSAAYAPDLVYHSVYCCFQQSCQSAPGEIALVGDRIPQLASKGINKWTYMELFNAVDRLCGSLLDSWGKAFGVDDQLRVGLYLPRSVDSIIVMLACQRLGVTLVPLDVHYPPVKTIQMIQAARLHSIITVPPQPNATAPRQASYPTCEQLATLAQQSATDPIPNLLDNIQVMDLAHLVEQAAVIDCEEPAILPCCCHDGEGKVATAMFGTAYLLFTSGSTGTSKCVAMTHYQLAIHIASLTQRLSVHQGDVFAPMASFCFVAHTRLWSALCNGACLLVPNDQQRTAIIPFSNLLLAVSSACGLRLSILDTSPAFLRMILQDWSVLLKTGGSDCLAMLRRVTLAGEIVMWKLVMQVYERHDEYAATQRSKISLSIVNLYGATECASTICAFIVPRAQNSPSTFVPVGSPLPTTKVFLLDDDGHPLSDEAIGGSTVGHVHVAGTRIELAPGYDLDPQATQARYIRHYQLEHQRMFKTGDMGRFTALGDLELVGRSDNMVKIRGQRVELEELESTLTKNELVGQCMVAAHRDEINDEEATIVAYIVPSPNHLTITPMDTPIGTPRLLPSTLGQSQTLTVNSTTVAFTPLNANSSSLLKLQHQLRTEVSKSHPFYYVPKHFVFVTTIARTPNGKLDRQAGKKAAAEYLNAVKKAEAKSNAETANESTAEVKAEMEKLIAELTDTERGLWALWLQVFTLNAPSRKLELLQAFSATKNGASDAVNGADDFDFFAMGGDSLLANQLVSFIAQSMKKQMAVRDVFESPSLISLAAAIEAAPAVEVSVMASDPTASPKSATTVFSSPPSQAGVDSSGRSYVDYDMSLSQQGMWWINEIVGKKLAAHHITHIYQLKKAAGVKDSINVRALETAMQFMIGRHEGLRTIFVTNATGEPKQRVLSAGGPPESVVVPPLTVKVSVQTVSSMSAMESVVDSIDHTPFALNQWPLFRVSLFKVDDENQAAIKQRTTTDDYLSITIHHLVSDGWATGLLLKEIAQAYSHFSDPNSRRRYSIVALAHPTLAPRSSMQFVQFQQEQNLKLARDEAMQVQYWVNELKEAAYLELPYDFARPLQRSYRGDFIHCDFPSTLSSALYAVSQSTRVSVFNLLLASFHLLLSKYSKQQDIVTGTASANRSSMHAQSVMGYCINMVACRSTVDPDKSFIGFAKQVQTKTLNGLENGAVPFQRVVDAVGKAKAGSKDEGMSRNPIFDVILLLQNQPIRKPYYSLDSEDSLSLHRVPFRAQHSQFDLAFLLEPKDKEFQLGVNFNRDVFRPETIARMVDNWLALLTRLCQSPSAPMKQHDWISESQRTQVVEQFNAKYRSIPLDLPMQVFFEQQVELTPNNIAVQSFEEAWTYSQLESNANRVAHALIREYTRRYNEPIKPDVLIGLYVDRAAGCNMPAAVLGILKSGAAYVPLDPTYPSQRLGYMIHDAKCALILTVSRMQDDLEVLIETNNHPDNISSGASGLIPQTPVICIDELLAQNESSWPSTRPPRINGSRDLAYVIFTSGSTGKPKGVMIQHLSVVNLAFFMRPYMHSHHQKDGTVKPVLHPRCLQFSSISFDVAVFEWATTLSSGGCLCLVPSVDHLLGEALLHTVKRYDITMLLASASSVAAVPLDSGANGSPLVDMSRLSFMSAGSEALQEAVLHRWMAACPQAFFNQYGPTEVTVTSHMCHYQPASVNPYHNNKVIGGGITNVHSYVLDDQMQPVPIGVIGELFIGGAGVARGYLNRPDLTEQRFVPNPFLSPTALTLAANDCGIFGDTMESTRVYKTGDLVRWTPSGELEYHGRNDDQVKIRGFRIEMGEIEKRILQHEKIAGAVVVLRKERQNGTEEPVATLVCFFTSRQQLANADLLSFINDLRSHVGSALPGYMVPTYFIHMEAIPQTCTGKFDRNMLTAMDIEADLVKLVQNRSSKKKAKAAKATILAVKLTTPAESVSSPKTPRLTESDLIEAVRSAWSTALSLDADDIDLTDHFFEIGGHSLLTIRILQLLPPSLKPHLQLADVFANPTMQAQIDLLKQRLVEANKDSAIQLFSTTPSSVNNSASNDSVLSLSSRRNHYNEDIAIIGMAGRFPHADDVHSFWRHLIAGDECIRTFSDEELRLAGIDPSLIANTNYVKALGLMGDHSGVDINASHAKAVFGFDHSFFEFSAKESELLDPQHRQFIEVCAQALDDAGCVPSEYQQPEPNSAEPRAIGVFAGCGRNTYLQDYLASSYDLTGANQHWHSLCAANDKDFLCSRVSYKLNLHGPAVVIQTACSSSLVAVHQAVQSLQRGECSLALAGGVSLGNLHPAGYLYQPDHILAPDGHCRAFDSQASGTVRGQGLAVIALKPLSQAIKDRDQIYSVLKSSAINNDGSNKASYSAPNPEGQRRVIAQAFLARPEIAPSSIGYVECHGTATKIGDVIELSALTRAYSMINDAQQGGKFDANTCAIGSVKSNIGHLDAAAGVAGLIKAALTVQRAVLPPSLHFRSTQATVSLNDSPFYVTSGEARPFALPAGATVRRAAVSSFGIGGTNAHVIIEQAPAEANQPIAAVEGARQHRVVCWSAKSVNSVRAMTKQLADHFQRVDDSKDTAAFGPNAASLAHAAFTLQTGRGQHNAFRRSVVAANLTEAIAAIRAIEARDTELSIDTRKKSRSEATKTGLAFVFSGQGSHFAGMGSTLYQRDPVFKAIADESWARIMALPSQYPKLLASVNFPVIDSVASLWSMEPTASWCAPIGLFVLELSVAWRLMRAGVTPSIVIGHSLGHFIAAVIAGRLSFTEATLMLVARSHLIHALSMADRGTMLSVSADRSAVDLLIQGTSIEVAGVNSPSNTVVAGATGAVEQLAASCQARAIRSIKVHTSHAYHSAFVDGILDQYRAVLTAIADKRISDEPLSSMPDIDSIARPMLADTVTGELVNDCQSVAFDVNYWVNHTRQAVLFTSAIAHVIEHLASLTSVSGKSVVLEMGPGRTCLTLMQQTLDAGDVSKTSLIASAQTLCGFVDIHKRAANANPVIGEDDYQLHTAVATAWQNGHTVQWRDFYDFTGKDANVHKVSLPAYAFDHSVLHCPQRALEGKRARWALAAPASPTASVVSAGDDVSELQSPSQSPSSFLPDSPLSASSPTVNQIRAKILSLFSDALGSKDLTDDSDFFDEGGDSVTAVSFTAAINAAFNLQSMNASVRTSTLLVTKTVGELTAHVANALNATTASLDSDVITIITEKVSPKHSLPVAENLRGRAHSSPVNSRVNELPVPSPIANSKSFAHLPRSFGPLYVLQWGSFRPDQARFDAQFLPLLLVHAVGGDILQYRGFTGHLHPNQPVFSFRAESLDGVSKPVESIKVLAAKYIDALYDERSPFRAWANIVAEQAARSFDDTPSPLCRDRQLSYGIESIDENEEPESPMSLISSSLTSPSFVNRTFSSASLSSLGLNHTATSSIEMCASSIIPVALAGHSFGGLVAFEMAAQLKARTAIAKDLAITASLSDTNSSSVWNEAAQSMELAVSKLILIDSPAPSRLPPTLDAAGVIEYVGVNRLQAHTAANANSTSTGNALSVNPAVVDTWLAHQKAMHAYSTETSALLVNDIDTLFVRPSTKNNLSEASGPSLNFHEAWLEILTESLTVAKVSGNHLTMMRDQPHVQHTASKIKHFTAIA